MGDSCLTKEFEPKNTKVIIDDKLKENPIGVRKYTLSFLSEENTINISDEYKMEHLKDNTFILGEIVKKDNLYKLVINVYFKNFDPMITNLIYKETKTNIHKILKNIIDCDKEFFITNEELMSIPIYVSFNSSYSIFNQVHLCGYIKDFTKVS